MIHLNNIDLPHQTQEELDALQARVNGEAGYAQQVDLAKKLFAQQNKPSNKIFSAVKRSLTLMCSGAKRCCYCEDSAADEVEHIWPKDLYPELVFVWANYLYACGLCNGTYKNNRFAVFAAVDGQVVDVTRPNKADVVPPAPGDPLLIDPRREDPLDYIELDLLGTFMFLPRDDAGSRSHIRAMYTIELLGLNDRDFLTKARGEAYESYRLRLSDYISQRNQGVPYEQLNLIVSAIRRMGHPTVWREMQRQSLVIPQLRRLFEQAPEALEW